MIPSNLSNFRLEKRCEIISKSLDDISVETIQASYTATGFEVPVSGYVLDNLSSGLR